MAILKIPKAGIGAFSQDDIINNLDFNFDEATLTVRNEITGDKYYYVLTTGLTNDNTKVEIEGLTVIQGGFIRFSKIVLHVGEKYLF